MNQWMDQRSDIDAIEKCGGVDWKEEEDERKKRSFCILPGRSVTRQRTGLRRGRGRHACQQWTTPS